MRQHLVSDAFQRNSIEGPGETRRRSLWPFAGYLVLALVLLVLGRLGHPFATAIQSAGLEASAPFVRAMHFVAHPVVAAARRFGALGALAEENDRLLAENQRLRAADARVSDLEMRLKSLETLAKTVEAPKIDFLTARVIADSGGPFVRSVMIDAGRDSGVKPGHPVMSADGVAGRVVAAGRRVSRVLLAVDFNSRIPVLVGPDQERAVMEGDNTPLARLSYRAAPSRSKPGDLVVTSGVGGLFPRGLQIGRIVDTGDTLRIEPSARFDRLDYLSVLLFDSPAGSLAGIELNSASDVAPLPDPAIAHSRGKAGAASR